jgi:hypothetical protein
MFVREEAVLEVGFDAARARLPDLATGVWLSNASEGAYDEGLVGLIRVGPLGGVPGMSKLVRVQVRDPVIRDNSAVLTLRWEATGPGGGLFPALDADITLAPEGADKTRLSLAGAYRPPFAGLGIGLDRTILRRVATATIRSLLSRVAVAITHPELATAGTGAGTVEPDAGTLQWMPDPDVI